MHSRGYVCVLLQCKEKRKKERKDLMGATLTSFGKKEFIPCGTVRRAIEEALGKALRNTAA